MFIRRDRFISIASPVIEKFRRALDRSKEEADLPANTLIGGKYRLGHRLGNGSMGRVYRASGDNGREVALKFPHQKGDGSISLKEASSLLIREGRALGMLDHPHIIRLIETGSHEGHPFLVLERIDGPTLRRIIKDRERIVWEDAGIRSIKVAEAIGAMHGRGIVHGDIKPGNIFFYKLGYEPEAKIFDLGFVAFPGNGPEQGAGSGMVRGTMEYMAPELLHGKPHGYPSDIFSFGTTLYRALSGVMPFDGSGPLETAMQIIGKTPEDIDSIIPGKVPLQVRRLIASMMEKDPSNRPGSASEIAMELRSAL